METTAGGRQRTTHRNSRSNRPSNKLRVNELTDSLQAELHLSLERLSDSELDQDDLKRLKQRNNNKHYHKQQYNDNNNDDDIIIDTQDSLEMIENKVPVRSVTTHLPRLLQRASEGGDILDSLDATDLHDVIEEEEEEDEDTYRDDVSNKETYDELMDDTDQYADLRYNYEPANAGVLKPVENFIDDVSNDESEYRYYDDGGSTLPGQGKGETPQGESEPEAAAAAGELLQAENDLLEEEYRKFFDQSQREAAGGVATTPSSGHVSSRGGRSAASASISTRTVTVKQPQIYRDQFERSAQRLRNHNVSPSVARATSKTSVSSRSPRVKQPPAQPILVKNIIERNRARAGQKSSSSSYLEIHSKKRIKKQQSIASQKAASASTSNMDKVGDNSPPKLLYIAKSETDLLHRRNNGDETETAEETWLKQQIRLKVMRKAGNPKKQRPPKQFLKIANENSTVAPTAHPPPSPPAPPVAPQLQLVANNPQQPYPPQQFHYDFTHPYPLLPPQRVQPYGGGGGSGYQQLPHNGNMTLDPYINGGYYYPPPQQQIPIYYQQQIDPSLAPSSAQKQPLPPIPRSSPQKPTAEISPPSGGGSAVQSPTTSTKPQRNSLPNYRKYTIDDYRNIKHDQGQFGGLGPDLSTAKTKAGNVTRAKQYAESVRTQHKAVVAARPQAAPHPRVQAEEDAEAVKRKRQVARQRALSYAREVPKPKVAPQAAPTTPETSEPARKSRIPVRMSEAGTPTGTARRQDAKLLSVAAADHLKRRSSSTFTIDKSGTSPGSGGVDLDLIRTLRERHEREKAMVAQITTIGK